MLFTAPHVEIILIDLTQTLNGIFTRHLFHRPFFLLKAGCFFPAFVILSAKYYTGKKLHFS